MARYLIVAFMLICSVAWGCDYCLEHPGEKEMRSVDFITGKMQDGWTEQHMILLRRINSLEDTLDKIYSMVADIYGRNKCGHPVGKNKKPRLTLEHYGEPGSAI